MVTAKLISTFVFATQIVHSLFFLNAKFQASNHSLWLCSPVCVGPVLRPERSSSYVVAQMYKKHLSLVVRKPVFRVSDKVKYSFWCSFGEIKIDLTPKKSNILYVLWAHLLSRPVRRRKGWVRDTNFTS